MTKNKQELAKTETVKIENTDDLRFALANELKKVATGQSTPAAANAFANLSGKILSSVKLELEYNKLAGLKPNIEFIKSISKQIPLGIKKNDTLQGKE